MGYTTDFFGEGFKLNKRLALIHKVYLKKFNDTRRMKRNPEVAEMLEDTERKIVGLPIGEDACYFVGGLGFKGQDDDSSIIEYNSPPIGQPGLWCQWRPSDDGMRIEWDGGEKFYDYVEWLSYIIDHFMRPWKYVLNGSLEWQGEDRNDIGKIIVVDNQVSTRKGKIVFEEEER